MFRRRYSFGEGLAIIHLAGVIIMAITILSQVDVEADFLEPFMGWLLFVFIDLPISFIFPLLLGVFSPEVETITSIWIGNFWLPLFFFGIFGTFQYFLIGTGLEWLFFKIIKKK